MKEFSMQFAFNIRQSVDKIGYSLNSLITRKSLKLVNHFLNQFTYQYYTHIFC